MKAYDHGAFVRVAVGPADVDRFASRWPCCTLDGRYSFTFDARGDLVDVEGPAAFDDGHALAALARNAQNYAARRLKRPALARPEPPPAPYVRVGRMRVW